MAPEKHRTRTPQNAVYSVVMNTISFTQFLAVPIAAAALYTGSAPGNPALFSFVPYSYYILFSEALAVWLCGAAGACLMPRRPLLCFMPALLFGAAIICGCSSSFMSRYTALILAASTLSTGAAELYLFFRKRQPPARSAAFDLLSPRERDVARLLLSAKTTGQIAAALFISPATVKTHIQNIYRKYEVSGRMEFSNKITGNLKNHPVG